MSLTCTVAVWSVTGANWTYCTWMSLPCRGEASTPVAPGSAEATAMSCGPLTTCHKQNTDMFTVVRQTSTNYAFYHFVTLKMQRWWMRFKFKISIIFIVIIIININITNKELCQFSKMLASGMNHCLVVLVCVCVCVFSPKHAFIKLI